MADENTLTEIIGNEALTADLSEAQVLVLRGLAGKAPRVNATNNHWEVYDNDTQAWVDTGVAATGADGATPEIRIVDGDGYHVVNFTLPLGNGSITKSFTVRDGADGEAGADGADGVSPTVTITEITRGHRVKITDAEHPNGQSFDVTNGFNGLNGTNGVDGHSPYIDPTTKTWWYFDDASGLWLDSNVDPDGYPGPAGADGYSPVVTVTTITGGHRVTITDKAHPQGQSFDVMDGADAGGSGGSGLFPVFASYSSGGFDFDKTGAEIVSAIFSGKIPIVKFNASVSGSDSFDQTAWMYAHASNDGEDTYLHFYCLNALGNVSRMSYCLSVGRAYVSATQTVPAPTGADNGKVLRVVNGAWQARQLDLSVPRIAMTAADTAPTLEANRLYVFPEMASLAPTLAAPSDSTIVNEYHFLFTSGATAATLTIPASVLQPDGFTVEANMHYEISILEGAMTAQGWAVTA